MVPLSDRVDCETTRADRGIHFERAGRQLTERFWCDTRDSLCRFQNSPVRNCKITEKLLSFFNFEPQDCDCRKEEPNDVTM